jgi:hypothetical protein
MKRYLLFAGKDYETPGGWNHFKDHSESLIELIENNSDYADCHWANIVDIHAIKRVAAGHSMGKDQAWSWKIADGYTS